MSRVSQLSRCEALNVSEYVHHTHHRLLAVSQECQHNATAWLHTAFPGNISQQLLGSVLKVVTHFISLYFHNDPLGFVISFLQIKSLKLRKVM